MDDRIIRMYLCIRRIPRSFADEAQCYSRDAAMINGFDIVSLSLPEVDDSEVVKQCKAEVRNIIDQQRKAMPPNYRMDTSAVLHMCETLMLQVWRRGYAARVEHENPS